MQHNTFYLNKGTKRPKKFNKIFDKLNSADNEYTSLDGLFENNKDIMVISALLAFENGLDRISLKNYPSKDLLTIAPPEWANDENVAIIYALAMAETKDPNIIHSSREDEVISIFEEYCLAGLIYMEENILKSSDPYGDVYFASLISKLKNRELKVEQDAS